MGSRQERGPLRIEEEDGSPTGTPVTLKVSNTTLTDNGDGTQSLTTSGGASVSDTAYGVGWNGDTTTAPSKNAVYDKIETLGSGAITVGTTALTSGTDTRVLFDDAGVVGEDAGFTYTKATDTLNLGTGIKTITDVPLHVTNLGSTSGVLLGNVTGVANRAFVGANTGSTYMVVGTGSTGLLFINNGGNTFRGSIGDGGNWRVASDATIATAKFEVDNGATAQSIFVAQDNGTATFTIADGGLVTSLNASGGTSVTHTINGNASTGSILNLTNAVAGTPPTLSFLGTSSQMNVSSNYTLLLSAGGSAGAAGYLDLNYGSGLSTWANYSARQKILLNYNAATTNTKNSSYVFTQAIGAGANGYGNGIALQGNSATVAARDMIRVSGVWSDATDATRSANFEVETVNNTALAPRLAIIGKQTTLTESTDTAFARIAVASSTVTGGVITYTIEANDSTDFQSLTGSCTYSIVNKAGTLTLALGALDEVSAVSSGTLTATLTLVDATSGNADFKLNAVSSLTQTTLRVNAQVTKNFGTGAITAQ